MAETLFPFASEADMNAAIGWPDEVIEAQFNGIVRDTEEDPAFVTPFGVAELMVEQSIQPVADDRPKDPPPPEKARTGGDPIISELPGPGYGRGIDGYTPLDW